LRSLVQGDLNDEDQAEVTQHIDQCSDCQHALDELAADGASMVQVGRHLGGTHTPPPESAFWPAVRRLQGVGSPLETQASVETPTELDLDFLKPSKEPGHLGKLDYYEVVEVIGHGGMGVVLRSFDTCLQRPVAIKVMASQFANNGTAKKRFVREARAAAALRHDNVVAIHAVDEVEGLPYFVMEYVPGISLEEHLERSGRLELEEILRIGAQTAAGLAAAHAQGLIHRDIKPANILLETGNERVKLTDFGLARAADDARLTVSGTVAGTPLYMAPEQARGESLDHRADLFSLGSVLYAMCTGDTPFAAGTPLAVLRRITDEKPKPIHELNPTIPDWLIEIVETLQAKDPADRFESATEVAELLQQHLAHLQHPSSVVMPCSQMTRARRKRRLLLSALGTGLVLGGLFVETLHIAGVPVPFRGRPAVSGEVQRSAAWRSTLSGSSGPIWSVKFSPDGKTVATAIDDGTVRLWTDGSVSSTINAHHGTVWAVAFSPDGRLLATASDDGTAKIWDVASGDERMPLKHTTAVRTVAFDCTGTKVATGGRDGNLHVWNAVDGKELYTAKGHTGTIVKVAFSPDARMIASASGDKTVKIWNTETGKEQVSLIGHTGAVYGVAFSPDSKLVASGGWDKTVRLWEASSGKELAKLEGHTQDVWSVCFAPDGRTLASGSEDRTLKLWDIETRRNIQTLTGHTGTIYTATFSPDSKMVASGGRDGNVMLWDASRGR
jgi:serine/threonine protein kinase